jgi:uncharacterized transporter YbjL
MKKKELIEILNQRKKECENHRKRYEKQLRDLRAEKELGFDREILGGIQHPIGYLTGVIAEIDNTKRLLSMSLVEYEKEKKEVEKHNRKQKKYLKAMLKQRTVNQTNKPKK